MNDEIYDVEIIDDADIDVIDDAPYSAFEKMNAQYANMASALQSYVDCMPKINTSALTASMQAITACIPKVPTLNTVGISSALQGIAVAVPKVDTSAMANALRAVADSAPKIDTTSLSYSMQALADSVPVVETPGITKAVQSIIDNDSVRKLSLISEKIAAPSQRMADLLCNDTLVECKTIADTADIVSERSSFMEMAATMSVLGNTLENDRMLYLGTMLENELTLADAFSNLLPDTTVFHDALFGFAERLKELLGPILERVKSLVDHFKDMWRSLVSKFLDGIDTLVLFVFHPSLPPPRIAITYDLRARLKPPIPEDVIKRRYLSFAPRIRKIFLRQYRERGDDSDSADHNYYLLVA